MKKFVSLIMISLLLVLSCAFLAQAENVKKTVAIITFSNATPYPRLGAAVAETLTVELVKNKNYKVVERSKLKQILGEQYLAVSGAVDLESNPIPLGKLKGVDYLITGAVLKAEQSTQSMHIPLFGGIGGRKSKTEIGISVRLVDVKTGEIIMAEEATGDSSSGGASIGGIGSFNEFESSSYGEATKEAVKNIVDKLNQMNPVEGLVVKVDGDKVYIDLGRQDGIEKGQEFKVFVEGELIKHPVTGEIMGTDRIEKAIIKVEDVLTSMSVCQLKKKSKTILQSGDKVVRKY